MSTETKLPYVVQPTIIPKVLDKIKSARTPDRFNYDFLQAKLGFKGGNYRQFISLAKKLHLLGSDGSPTDLYKSLRNSAKSGAAMAQAMRLGYSELFERNEYAGNLKNEDLRGLVVEITGRESKDRVVQLVLQTFNTLRDYADFDATLESYGESEEKREEVRLSEYEDNDGGYEDIDLRLNYTINLVLPKTDDPAVFNAIFRALRENLLRK